MLFAHNNLSTTAVFLVDFAFSWQTRLVCPLTILSKFVGVAVAVAVASVSSVGQEDRTQHTASDFSLVSLLSVLLLLLLLLLVAVTI